MKHVFDEQECVAFIKTQNPLARIYFGSDSERFKRNGVWMAQYAVAVAIHMADGGGQMRGCKVFGEITLEQDHDQSKNKPALRLFREVELVSLMYNRLSPHIQDFWTEVHVDLNPDKKFGSSVIIESAMGYLKGTCIGADAILHKDLSLVASFCADRLPQILDEQRLTALAS